VENKFPIVKVTTRDFQAWGIKPGSFVEMLDAFFDMDLPKTGGGEPIVYDLGEVFEGLVMGFFPDEEDAMETDEE